MLLMLLLLPCFGEGVSSLYALHRSSLFCRDCPQAPNLTCLVRLLRLLLLLLRWVWFSFEDRILQNSLSVCRANRGTSCSQRPPSYFDPYKQYEGGARDVIVIVVGNEHGDMSSNPGRD